MLHRFKLWLRRTWDKLPVLLSLVGWPPLLSHGLAFIMGTLMLRPAHGPQVPPVARILIPLDKLARVENESKVWQPEQKFSLLQRFEQSWCRTAANPIATWSPSGKQGQAYLLWPSSAEGASRLGPLLQKKIALTLEPDHFAFCSSKKPQSSAEYSAGVSYD